MEIFSAIISFIVISTTRKLLTLLSCIISRLITIFNSFCCNWLACVKTQGVIF